MQAMSKGLNLSGEEINKIRELLPSLKKADCDDLVRLLNRLIFCQVLSLSSNKDALTGKELKAELRKVRRHYQEAANGLRFLTKNGISPTLFDQHYLLGNLDNAKKTNNFFKGRNSDIETSGVEQETLSLINAIENFESEITTPKGRQKAIEFQYFITEIAKFFNKNLPSLAISDYPNMHFFKLIRYLVSEVLSPRLQKSKKELIRDPKRHIPNALKEFKLLQSV